MGMALGSVVCAQSAALGPDDGNLLPQCVLLKEPAKGCSGQQAVLGGD